MNRAAALAYLTSEFTELADDAQLTSGDQTSAYGTAIDNALRQLGYAEGELALADVLQESVLKYLALLEYFALKRFVRILSTRVTVSLPGPVQAHRYQAFTQVNTLLKAALDDLVAYGIEPGVSPTFEIGRITLDFLEPSWEAL